MCVQACAQSLSKVGVICDTALQCLIEANKGGYDQTDHHTTSLKDLRQNIKKHCFYIYNSVDITQLSRDLSFSISIQVFHL